MSVSSFNCSSLLLWAVFLSSPFNFMSLSVIFSTKFKRFCGFQICVGGIFCVPASVNQSKFNGDNLCVKKLGLWSNMRDKLSIMVFILDGQVIAQSYVVKPRPTRIEKKKIHQVCCLQNFLRHIMLKIAFKFFYCRLYWHDEWVKTRSYPIESEEIFGSIRRFLRGPGRFWRRNRQISPKSGKNPKFLLLYRFIVARGFLFY